MIRGFQCSVCHWIGEKPVNKTIKGMPFTLCPSCSRASIIPWEKPLNERPGRCGLCGKSHFKLGLDNHEIIRRCEYCGEVFNVEQRVVLKKGVLPNGH